MLVTRWEGGVGGVRGVGGGGTGGVGIEVRKIVGKGGIFCAPNRLVFTHS